MVLAQVGRNMLEKISCVEVLEFTSLEKMLTARWEDGIEEDEVLLAALGTAGNPLSREQLDPRFLCSPGRFMGVERLLTYKGIL